jgi:hypothetical protein
VAIDGEIDRTAHVQVVERRLACVELQELGVRTGVVVDLCGTTDLEVAQDLAGDRIAGPVGTVVLDLADLLSRS